MQILSVSSISLFSIARRGAPRLPLATLSLDGLKLDFIHLTRTEFSKTSRRSAMRKRPLGQVDAGASEGTLRLSLGEAKSHVRRKLRRQVVKLKHWEWRTIVLSFDFEHHRVGFSLLVFDLYFWRIERYRLCDAVDQASKTQATAQSRDDSLISSHIRENCPSFSSHPLRLLCKSHRLLLVPFDYSYV